MKRKTTHPIGTSGYFGKRLKIWRYQRSAGKRIPGTPIWVKWEWQRGDATGVGALVLSVGNPHAHARWAFNAFLFYKGV